MPKSSKSSKQFEPYKKLLLKIKEQVKGDIAQMADESSGLPNERGGDVSGHALHMADVATDMYDREFNLGLASNDREVLYKVDEALVRIEDGNYGTCSECKKAIPVARLKAIPYAQTCMKCQEKIENRR